MMARRIFDYFRRLNLFENRLINDEYKIRNQLISTRFYLCTFYVLILFLMISNILQKKVETIIIEQPLNHLCTLAIHTIENALE
jgi:hypothetical protein